MVENGENDEERTQSEEDNDDEGLSLSPRKLRSDNMNGKKRDNTLISYGFKSISKRNNNVIQNGLPALENRKDVRNGNVKILRKKCVDKERVTVVSSDDESDQERTELKEEEEKLEYEEKETIKGGIDRQSEDTNDTEEDEDDDIDQEQGMETDEDEYDNDLDNYQGKINAASNVLNMMQFLLLASQKGAN